MSVIKIDWNPPQKHLKQFALLWFPAFIALVGGLVWYKGGRHDIALGIWGVGLLISAIGFAVPSLMRYVWVGIMLVTFPIGWVVSHVLLASVYYLFMTPLGLIMRAFGYDPMQRKLEPNVESYWVERKPVTDKNSYFRQF